MLVPYAGASSTHETQHMQLVLDALAKEAAHAGGHAANPSAHETQLMQLVLGGG